MISAQKLHNAPLTDLTKVELYYGLTADAAAYYSQFGSVTLFNFANGVGPGGGYLTGCTAQEEELCRQYPALYTSLAKAKHKKVQRNEEMQTTYPFGPPVAKKAGSKIGQEPVAGATAVLWTYDIECRRGNKQDGFRVLDKKEPYYHTANVVSAAAPDRRIGHDELFDPISVAETLKNVMLAEPYFRLTHGGKRGPQGTIILGAWGAGAFRNDVKIMAGHLIDAVNLYGGHYERIVFAVPEDLGIGANTGGVIMPDDLASRPDSNCKPMTELLEQRYGPRIIKRTNSGP